MVQIHFVALFSDGSTSRLASTGAPSLYHRGACLSNRYQQGGTAAREEGLSNEKQLIINSTPKINFDDRMRINFCLPGKISLSNMAEACFAE